MRLSSARALRSESWAVREEGGGTVQVKAAFSAFHSGQVLQDLGLQRGAQSLALLDAIVLGRGLRPARNPSLPHRRLRRHRDPGDDAATRQRSFDYFGVADHSKSADYAGGLSVEEIAQQHRKVDKLNKRFGKDFRILKGIESDILADGSLDYADDLLQDFDFVVASIHGRFKLDRKAQTQRLHRPHDPAPRTIDNARIAGSTSSKSPSREAGECAGQAGRICDISMGCTEEPDHQMRALLEGRLQLRVKLLARPRRN